MLLPFLKRVRSMAWRSRTQYRAALAKAHIAKQEYSLAAEQLAALAELEPQNAAWPAAQADCHARAGDMKGAARSLEAALALAPQQVQLWTKLGYARWELALVDEAIAAYRRAIECDPRTEPAGGNLLFALLHRSESPAECLREAKRWATFAVPRDSTAAAPFTRVADPERRLRVGYVSADFRTHAMSSFIEALLAWHDTERFELVCYDGTSRSDRVSALLQEYDALWRPTGTLDDAAFASQVRADRIDVLVDLSGHTAGNRLRALGRRLAPVQVCGPGYPGTTGLESFDWRVTDALNDPPDSADAYYTEPLYRLPDFCWNYRPATPSPVPREPGGELMFGSLNNVRKITPRMVALWAQILRRVPRARLLIAGTPLGPARDRIVSQLTGAGVAEERLDLQAWLSQDEYVALHGKVDIALDTYPYNGSTTTFEALYHGVPVITLAGPVFVSRHGRATLEALGEARFAADSDEGYVALAAKLAGRPEQLPALRRELHNRMRASVILDERGYVARLENAYREMWRQWCNRAEPVTSATVGSG